MNIGNLNSFFSQHINVMRSLNKLPVRYSRCLRSKGNRLLKKARKYHRPEDLKDPFYHGIGPKEEIKSLSQSIAARGFAREQISYTPATNVEEQLHSICKKLYSTELGSDWKNHSLNDQLLKYKVLTKAIETFKKNIPNSLLHRMSKIEDLVTYFNTPVDGCLHYDALVRDAEKLPPNLHVLPDTPTFNPDTDSFFDGVTAFPGRKRIIHTKYGQKFEKVIEWPHI